jgi:hypothetical protein
LQWQYLGSATPPKTVNVVIAKIMKGDEEVKIAQATVKLGLKQSLKTANDSISKTDIITEHIVFERWLNSNESWKIVGKISGK